WGARMPAIARDAGVSYHAARRRASVAERIPSASPIRALGLPYTILRLLAPLPQPEPWAEKAHARQQAGTLHAGDFARLLEESGLRRSRARSAPQCLHCCQEIPDNPHRIFIRHA